MLGEDQKDPLLAHNQTAAGVEKLVKLVTAFCQQVEALPPQSPEFWQDVREFGVKLKTAVPGVAALATAEAATITRAAVLKTVKTATDDLQELATPLHASEAERDAISRGLAYVPTTTDGLQITRYAADLHRQLKFLLQQLAPYRRRSEEAV